jgi:hypothetical protein
MALYVERPQNRLCIYSFTSNKKWKYFDPYRQSMFSYTILETQNILFASGGIYVMAWVMRTEELEAIPASAIHLKAIEYEEIIDIDEAKDKVKRSNGGFADMLLELRKGIFTVLRCTEVTHLRSRERITS